MNPAVISLIVLIALGLMLLLNYFTSLERDVWRMVKAMRIMSDAFTQLGENPDVSIGSLLEHIIEMETELEKIKYHTERFTLCAKGDKKLLHALSILKVENEKFSKQLLAMKMRVLT